MPEIEHIPFEEPLRDFPPVTLEEMDSVKLMNRIDTKYLTSERILLELLDDAYKAGYKVLVIEVERILRIVAEEPGFGQVFITDVDRNHIDRILEGIGTDHKVFTIENGYVI